MAYTLRHVAARFLARKITSLHTICEPGGLTGSLLIPTLVHLLKVIAHHPLGAEHAAA
jgi:hypothetical protein